MAGTRRDNLINYKMDAPECKRPIGVPKQWRTEFKKKKPHRSRNIRITAADSDKWRGVVIPAEDLNGLY